MKVEGSELIVSDGYDSQLRTTHHVTTSGIITYFNLKVSKLDG